jgi:hypothetical protein
MRPSFLAHIINGVIAFIATFMFIFNYGTFETKDKIIILSLLSIAWGMHAILHHFEEIYYGFNPLKGQNYISDVPLKLNR